jgi:hypothetical protein
VERLPEGAPLTDAVVFLLHPTFGNDRISVVLPVNDAASDSILTEGDFIVVAICDAGKTVLSFPLAGLPRAPAWFLSS